MRVIGLGAPEPAASLRRVRRDAAVICLASAAAALAVMGGRPEGALGVLAGGALMAVSYTTIRGGVDAAIRKTSVRAAGERAAAASASRAAGWAAFRFVARYGIIAVLAWAVLVPLRAHPLGVFAGVTAPVLAIGIEAIRLMRR
jgi:hypothetical protein